MSRKKRNLYYNEEGVTLRLKGKRVACLVDHEFEDLELWGPVMRCREEGAEVHFVGPEAHKVYKGKYGVPAESDRDYTTDPCRLFQQPF